MFRRRPLRRPIRRAFIPDVPPLLKRANALLVEGNYPAAAEAFEQLSNAAAARNGPRAPIFFLQAGRARLLAGQTEAAMTHFKRGLSMFAARNQLSELQRAGTRIVAELTEQGLTAEAKQIEDYLKDTLPSLSVVGPGSVVPAGGTRPLLPTNCPGCGGPIRAVDITWVDQITAECPYCGSAVRGE